MQQTGCNVEQWRSVFSERIRRHWQAKGVELTEAMLEAAVDRLVERELANQQPEADQQQIEQWRLVFSHRLCKQWREGGHDWTTGQLESAVDALVWLELAIRAGIELTEAMLEAAVDEPADAQAVAQLELLPIGLTAQECRAEAFLASADKLPGRKRQVLKLLADAGRDGLTRYEIAEQLGMAQNSITQAVKQLLISGDAVELRRKRASRAGGRGTVIALQEFAEGRAHAS